MTVEYTGSIPPGRIVWAGDSITLGYNLDPEDCPPAVLEELIGVEVENLGVSAATAAPEAAFGGPPMGWGGQLADLTGLPGTCILLIGTNDLYFGLSTVETRQYIDEWVARQQVNGWRVCVLPIIKRKPEEMAAYDRITVNEHLHRRHMAQEMVGDALLGDDADTSDTNIYQDGVHPTAFGAYYLASFYAYRALRRVDRVGLRFMGGFRTNRYEVA